MKINRSLLFFLISPVLGLLSVVFAFAERRKISFVALAFSVSLIYSYFPLLWDVRNNFFRIFLRPEDGLSFYTSIIGLGVFDLGFSYIAVIFAITTLILLCYGYAMGERLQEIRVSESRSYYLCAFLLFVTLFEYRQVVDIQKTSLSIAVFLVGLAQPGEVRRWLLFSLAVLIHPLLSIVVLLYVLAGSKLVPSLVYKLLLPVAVVFGLFFSKMLVQLALSQQSFVPQNVVLYLLLDESRFSSSAVADLVKFLRIASLSAIAIVFYGISAAAKDRSQYLLSRLVILSCALALLFSFNEISLERFYLFATVVAVYSAIMLKIPRKYLFVVSVAVLLNVAIHGFYTLKVVFSEDYEVLASQGAKMSMVYKLMYLPTPLLVLFDVFGSSDDYLMKNAMDSL